MTEDGYVPVDSATLQTRFPGVYAVGDVATAGVPKAGVFAEGAARVVARALIAKRRGEEPPERHLGRGTCYIEFGQGRVGSVDIDFSRARRTGTFNAPAGRADRGEAELRLDPPRALVRALIARGPLATLVRYRSGQCNREAEGKSRAKPSVLHGLRRGQSADRRRSAGAA